KAWYGDAATAENDFGFPWLTRIDDNYSQMVTFDRMARGAMKGYVLFGQNPGGGGPNAGLHRAGLRSLDWLVVLDWFETESAVFWKNDPNGPPPAEIKTEVFFIPVAASPEKEGTLTNTQRLLQWHSKAIDPPTGLPRLVSGFSELKDDGTTACGCWIYSGVYPEPGRNRARERRLTDNPLQPEWGFAWPHNRRILYNRASADPEGRPWSERKKLVWWDEDKKRWVGLDEPDFEPGKPPDYRPPSG